MRVSDAGARAEERRGVEGARRFREALRRAGERPAVPRDGARLDEAALAIPARRSAADRKDAVLGERRERFREDEAGRPSALPAVNLPRASEAAQAEFRALVRSLPLSIDVARIRAGEPLAFSLGRSLDVEIRPALAGVEILLRPEPRLARAAAAEVPGLVAALRARGVSVARVEVRVRGAVPARGPNPGRVDGAPPLR